MFLNEEFKLKNITLRNRIVMPPMAREMSDDGRVSTDLIEYYRKRAKDTGLVIVEHAYVSLEGKSSKKQLSMADDSVIDGFKELTDAIHNEKCFAIAQLNHARPQSIAYDKSNVNNMTKEDIKKVKDDFKNASIRTKKAGFDGVEIHAAHEYLLNHFYSPLTNKRADEYGGNLENRLRLANEIIQDVRKSVGEDYIVAIRFGAYDYWEGGSKLDEIPIAVKSFIDSGVDLIDISGGLCRFQNPYSKEPGYFKELSKIAKEASSVPVILTGGVKKAKDAEKLLKEGYCDLIGIGRAMIMDAEWSKKALKSLENMQ
ncbi:NADH:flavin oxidoreductase [uncultured Methanobrevibacter sp.]|uniref:NADH:flavin oxidoreductase n=1 Tax=uncultured Methanobrevibacter sp. TaxID=253161 RepID=UPI002607D06E|nr:NADH:flavin oxidoreductase [uncultured Methanobrevibacter sp.]